MASLEIIRERGHGKASDPSFVWRYGLCPSTLQLLGECTPYFWEPWDGDDKLVLVGG